MAPAHHKPLMLLSATRPTFYTMTQLLHTLKQLPLCNSQTQVTRSLATSSLFLASALPLSHLVSPKPEPSRSFRPTRFLAASFLVLPLALPPLSPFSYFFSTARTQWAFPAHGLLQPPLSSLLPPSSLFYLLLGARTATAKLPLKEVLLLAPHTLSKKFTSKTTRHYTLKVLECLLRKLALPVRYNQLDSSRRMLPA